MVPLKLHQGVGPPLEFHQGTQSSSQVAAGTQGSSLVVAGSSGFPQELPQVNENSSRNQCSSGFEAWDAGFHWRRGVEVRVLLEFGWYSGFLVNCIGASC